MKGLLIVNTGSPESQNKEDVKWFIGEMLSDPLVMTVPDWFRDILAKKIIAPLRCKTSAKHYSLIWDNEHNASPLIYHTQSLADKIEAETEIPVEIGMRYGEPSISEALNKLQQRSPKLHEVVVIPMFPQYAQSSYQTAVNEVGKCFYQKHFPFRLKILEPFYNDLAYIKALSISLKQHIEKGYDRLIFSFHSLPLSHEEEARKKGKQFDYVYQIKETIRLVTHELGLDPQKNRIVYSSAIGKKWLEPDLKKTMKSLPKEGIKKIIILTAGFPADNLESYFDINIEARKIFMDNGGTDFTFVHGLNSEDYWVNSIIKMVTRKS
ncbi:MAG: ferrochelatase [Dysgonomonas sp.]